MTEESNTLILESGVEVVVVELRTRQFFRLMKIITHGAGAAIADLANIEGSVDEFVYRLLATVVLAIPDAEQETVDFLYSMVEPAGLKKGAVLNKQDREINTALWAAVDAEMANPEVQDTVSIIEAVVKREGEDLQALGKRLISMFKIAEKTGQLEPQTPAEAVLPETDVVVPTAKKSAKKAASED